MRDIGAIQGFILELDDGTFASDFRVKYFFVYLMLIYACIHLFIGSI